MSARGVVVDSVTGEIKRTITGDPAQFAVQIASGETMFALATDDGVHIDDANLIIDESGEWALAEGAPEGGEAPDYGLGLIVP